VIFPVAKDVPVFGWCLGERGGAGGVRRVVDGTYPLDDIAEAYRYVDTEQKVGNVVIIVGP
jgi:hypothetical protein